MGLLGEVQQMDVDGEGKASGAFLRARVSIEVNKPIKRGVLLRMSREGEPEWFNAQYEKLPFFCYSCGIMGHSGLECENPAPRDANGKLPYEREIPLRAPDDRKKKLQSFVDAAAESYGSGTSSGARSTRGLSGRPDGRRAGSREDGARRSATTADARGNEDGEEVTSPLKNLVREEPKGKEKATGNAGRQLFQIEKEDGRKTVKKRKQKRDSTSSSQTPDLNVPIVDSSVLVPAGLVSSRMNQLVGSRESADGATDELNKKQKTSNTTPNARSAAAASGSPRRAQ
ncbi:unnamed protein product [Urochloa humidicola]